MKKLFLSIVLFCIFLLPQVLPAQPIDNPAQPGSDSQTTWIQKIETWYENNMSYGSITALMAIESSVIPFPSEIVIPPAAYIASKPGSDLNIFLVMLFGTLGALIGAYINYFLALWLGRPVIYKIADSKIGKLLLLSGNKVQKAENYFNKYGNISTFIGRLIPVIRQLISLPAGLSRMNLASFTVYTLVGAGIWNIVLSLIGYLAHGQADLINKYSHELKYIILAILILIISYVIIRYFIRKKRRKSSEENIA